jgi:hypothetical protein
MKIIITTIIAYFVQTTLSFSEIKDSEKMAFTDGCSSAMLSERSRKLAFSQFESLDEELRVLHEEHYYLLVNNKKFRARICDDAAALVLKNPLLREQIGIEGKFKNSFSRTAVDMQQQIMNGYFEQGIKRLNGKITLPYFSFKKSNFVNADPFFCKLMMAGAGDLALDAVSLKKFLMDQQNNISVQTTKNYLKLAREAMLLVVNEQGLNIAFESEEAKAVEEAFGDYLIKYAASFENAEKLAYIFTGQIQGTNEEYCDLGRLYYGALKTMPQNAGKKIRELYFHDYGKEY